MRLLLNKLTKLLEMGVAAEELQAAESFTTSGTRTGAGTSSTARSPTTFTTGLSSSFEEVEVRLVATGRNSGGSRSSTSRGWLRVLSLLLLLFLDVIGNSLS